jgi:4-diphosphocytidyl-2-C-methyl-D-erythritol kinase
MAAWTRSFVLSARAKLNLGLWLGNSQPNGLHEIRSFVASLSLADVVMFRPHDGAFTVVCAGLDSLAGADVPEHENLAYRAAAALEVEADGIAIRIEKRIPVQAGLGGGSADAAAALAGLARIARERGSPPFSDADFVRAATSLGSDIPACLVSGFKRISGTGEIVRPDPIEAPAWGVALLKPAAGMPTATAYRLYDEWMTESRRRPEPVGERDGSGEIAACVRSGRFAEFCKQIHNDFDPIVRRTQPEVDRAHDRLRAAGAGVTLLCGSGTAVAGFFPSILATELAVASVGLAPGEWKAATGFAGAE